MSKQDTFTEEELYKEFTSEEIEAMVPDKPIVKVYEPYAIWGLKKESSRHTICDELRKAYEFVENGEKDEALLSIRVAMRMGKAMGTRLKEHNLRISRELWPIKSALKLGIVDLEKP
jgi:hypothetical protein